jgi:hypothetical protein
MIVIEIKREKFINDIVKRKKQKGYLGGEQKFLLKKELKGYSNLA